MIWQLLRRRAPVRRRPSRGLLVEALESRELLSAALADFSIALPLPGPLGFQLYKEPVRADFNGDKVPDLAMLNFVDAAEAATTKSVTVYHGIGSETALTGLGAPVELNPNEAAPQGISPGMPYDLAAGDFDDDGNADLAVLRELYVRVYWGSGAGISGTFTDVVLPNFNPPDQLVAGDFHNLGRDELVGIGQDVLHTIRFTGRTATRGRAFYDGPDRLFVSGNNFSRARVADFTGDDSPDIAFESYLAVDAPGGAVQQGAPVIIVVKSVPDAAGAFQRSSVTNLGFLGIETPVQVAELGGDKAADLYALRSVIVQQAPLVLEEFVSFMTNKGGDGGFNAPQDVVNLGRSDGPDSGATAPLNVVLGPFLGDDALDLAVSFIGPSIHSFKGLQGGGFAATPVKNEVTVVDGQGNPSIRRPQDDGMLVVGEGLLNVNDSDVTFVSKIGIVASRTTIDAPLPDDILFSGDDVTIKVTVRPEEANEFSAAPAGKVTLTDNGTSLFAEGFIILGSHTYLRPGTYPIEITVMTKEGSATRTQGSARIAAS